MHGRSGRRPHQQTLTFDRRERWQRLPDPDQRRCNGHSLETQQSVSSERVAPEQGTMLGL